MTSRMYVCKATVVALVVAGIFCLVAAGKTWLLSDGTPPEAGGYYCSWTECCDGTHNHTLTCWQVPEASAARRFSIGLGCACLVLAAIWFRIIWKVSGVPRYLPENDSVVKLQVGTIVLTVLIGAFANLVLAVFMVANLSGFKTPQSQDPVSSPHSSGAGLCMVIGYLIAILTTVIGLVVFAITVMCSCGKLRWSMFGIAQTYPLPTPVRTWAASEVQSNATGFLQLEVHVHEVPPPPDGEMTGVL